MRMREGLGTLMGQASEKFELKGPKRVGCKNFES